MHGDTNPQTAITATITIPSPDHPARPASSRQGRPHERLEDCYRRLAPRKRAIDRLRRRRLTTVTLDAMADVQSGDTTDGGAVALDVQDALGRLSDDQREALQLAYFGGMTQTEISAALDVPLGTVKARTFRGLRAMRTVLAE